jgi:hypothetical protein
MNKMTLMISFKLKTYKTNWLMLDLTQEEKSQNILKMIHITNQVKVKFQMVLL